MDLLNQTCFYDDKSIGPASSCRAGFDFTLYFEQIFFLLVPSSILLLSSPLRIWQLRREDAKVKNQDNLRYVKLVSYLTYAILQLVLVLEWGVIQPEATNATMAASVLTFLNAMALLVLSSYEHQRSVRPSLLLNLYLLISLLLEIAVARTLALGAAPVAIAGTFIAAVCFKTVLLVLETIEKGSILNPRYAGLSLESLSGFYSRSVYWWLNKLFLKGYSNNISMNDLTGLDESLCSESEDLKAMGRQVTLKLGPGEWAMPKLLVILLWKPILGCVVPKLCLIGFTFTQPSFINAVISFAGNPSASSAEGYGLVAAALLIYCGIAICNVHTQRATNRTLIMIRALLVPAIYDKMLHLSMDSKHKESALGLINVDTEQLLQSLNDLISLWANLISAIIAFALLYLQVGPICFVLLVETAASTAFSNWIGTRAKPLRKKFQAAVATRIAATSGVLGSVKGIKMMGLSHLAEASLQAYRKAEMDAYSTSRKYNLFLIVFAQSKTPVCSIIILGAFIGLFPERFTVSNVFTIIGVLSLLVTPLSNFAVDLFFIQTSKVNLHRIQEFLLLPNVSDGRSMLDGSFEGVEGSYACILEDATISFPDGESFLKRLTLKMPSRGLTLVLGPTGSGKTTLCRAITGELDLTTGSNRMRSLTCPVAGVHPWLTNSSIENNIIGEHILDRPWFEQVITACGFDAELRALLQEAAVVGSEGTSLSGGQKQRIALARAVYSREPMIVLDNPFSGLDGPTKRHTIYALLGRTGLLRDRAVVLAMSTPECLSLADEIVLFRKDGTIEAQGSYQKLQSEDVLSKFVKSELTTTESNAVIDPKEKITTSVREIKPRPTQTTISDLTRRKGDFSAYSYYFSTVNSVVLPLFIATGILRSFCQLFPSVWLEFWAEYNEAHLDQRVGYYYGVYTVISLLEVVCTGLMLLVLYWILVPGSSIRIHNRLLKSVITAPLSFFTSTDSGTTLNRFAADMTNLDTVLPIAFMFCITTWTSSFGSIALILAGSKYLGAVVPGLLVLLYFLAQFYLRLSRQMRLLDLETRAPLVTHITESSTGVATIKAFGWISGYDAKLRSVLDTSQRAAYLQLCVQQWLALVLDLTVGALTVLLVGLTVALHGNANAGALGVALVNILTFTPTMATAITSYTNLETSLGAITRTKTFVETMVPESEPEGSSPSLDWPRRGAVSFRNVCASYSEDGISVAKDLNLEVAPGEKIAVVGRSGSGKSSCVLLLSRMLDYSSGEITIDGIDLKQIKRQQVRTGLACLPQEPIFIPGTVRQNADPFSTHSDQKILDVLQSIGLGLYFASPASLDVPMHDVKLSKGQKQLFAIAALSLRETKFVATDEITSNLDDEGFEKFKHLMHTRWRDVTMLCVTHYLHQIPGNFDKVVVIQDGEIVQQGRPGTLLEDAAGVYARMWKEQLRQ